MTELCFKDARDLARMIRSREVSAAEVMTACLAQIDLANPEVNAICTFVGEEASLRAAREADERLMKGAALGPLHGLPVAVKDLALTAGLRTTFGSLVPGDRGGIVVKGMRSRAPLEAE